MSLFLSFVLNLVNLVLVCGEVNLLAEICYLSY